MNDLLESKLTICRIKVQLLDLAGELIADETSNKDYAIERMLRIIEYIDDNDVKICNIKFKKSPGLFPRPFNNSVRMRIIQLNHGNLF